LAVREPIRPFLVFMGYKGKDITGMVFGRLTAMYPIRERYLTYIQWRCRCECGNEKTVPTKHLLTGGTKSCGCITPQEDLVGKRFGRLLVLSFHSKNSKGAHVRWNCFCDCGNTTVVLSGNLKNGHTKSCGCLKDESIGSWKHGKKDTSEYNSWSGAIQRCTNPNNEAYPRYGGRGICFFGGWVGEHGFENFYAYMGPKPTPEHSLDRWPNNDGHYEPGNVRWGTDEQQRRNKNSNRWLEADGKKMILADWAKHLGMCTQNLYRDLKKWPIEEIILKRKNRKTNG
jgi:hypothetical protein